MAVTSNQQRLLQELAAEREKLTRGASSKKLKAYRAFFTTPEGQIVLEDLRASYGAISFVPGYPDLTAFKEGRRSVLDDILAVLDLAKQTLEPTN